MTRDEIQKILYAAKEFSAKEGRGTLPAAVIAELAELAMEGLHAETYRQNWLTFQNLTGEECMELALPIVEGWKDSARKLERALSSLRSFDSSLADHIERHG